MACLDLVVGLYGMVDHGNCGGPAKLCGEVMLLLVVAVMLSSIHVIVVVVVVVVVVYGDGGDH